MRLGQNFKSSEQFNTCCGRGGKSLSHPVDDLSDLASIPGSVEGILGTKLELRAYSLKMHAGHHN